MGFNLKTTDFYRTLLPLPKVALMWRHNTLVINYNWRECDTEFESIGHGGCIIQNVQSALTYSLAWLYINHLKVYKIWFKHQLLFFLRIFSINAQRVVWNLIENRLREKPSERLYSICARKIAINPYIYIFHVMNSFSTPILQYYNKY